METKVYVDVLITLNYIVNLLLLLCTAKLTGRRPRRRRIVAAALFGSASALTIFLPFFGFFAEFFLRIGLAAVIVGIAFPYRGPGALAKQLFVFFAVSFFFSGIMLAVWMVFAPSGMVYYNGIVYLDISAAVLIACTVAAYAALSLFNRFSRGGRLKSAVYGIRIEHQGRQVLLQGLVDTGNRLYEPFSDTPVLVCGLDSLSALFTPEVVDALRRGEHLEGDFTPYGLSIRLIPFQDVGGHGLIPAFRPDRLLLTEEQGGQPREREVHDVFVAAAPQKIGGAGYNAILNPDLIAVHL